MKLQLFAHVESAVVRLHRVPAQDALSPEDASVTVEVVDAAFAQRRKTLRNSMAACEKWGRAQLDAAFALMGIDGGCRAESLTKDQFIGLALALRDGEAPERYRSAAPTTARAPKAPKKRRTFDPDLI